MTAGKPSSLVPKLRFSEFQRAGDWKRDQIGNFASITKGKGVSKADVRKNGATPCIRYAELYTCYSEVIREVVSRTDVPHEDLVLSQAEDVIVPASGETRADIARAACVLDERVALGSDLNILRSDLYGPFLSYLLNSPLRHAIAQLAQGDTVAHLYPKQLLQVWLTYPSPSEQLKIADCLGSLDDVIAAEGRKLDTLRQHKKGLMQQLFPRPGETQPQLRFPEFRDSKEWQKAVLSHLCRFQNGHPFPSNDFGEERQGFRLIRNRDLRFDDRVVYYDGDPLPDFIVNDGDLLVGMDGDFTPCVWHKGAGLLNQRVGRILPRGKHVLGFLSYLLEIGLKAVQRDTARTTVKHLSGRTVEGMVVHAPNPDEQRKIADCLGSLDALIATEGRKLEALQQHKQRLMQQLFPSLERQ